MKCPEDSLFDMKARSNGQRLLREKLDHVIRLWVIEYDMTYTEVIGVLEVLKLNFDREAENG